MKIKEFLNEINKELKKGDITLDSEIVLTASVEEYDDLFTYDFDMFVEELPNKERTKYLKLRLN
jgi:hypothetical protein